MATGEDGTPRLGGDAQLGEEAAKLKAAAETTGAPGSIPPLDNGAPKGKPTDSASEPPPRMTDVAARLKTAVKATQRNSQSQSDTRSKFGDPNYSHRVAERRRAAGYILGSVTIVAAAVFFVWSIGKLDALKGPPDSAHERFALAKLAGHAVITVAFMYFVYSILRVAERMLIPDWWSMQQARLMLGMRDPTTNVLKIATKLSSVFEKLGLQVVAPAKKEEK